ncbi:MAG: hypothetical protein A2Y17_04830 [Clostridiales bacterium GWF2_38_85]|nr:MAG: hypothetical protein A2Y17_04830 [Clostridiales bacterium GWF2_38_85]HBL84387.1 hypothetical protein [Clostridiales bacterium]
MLIRWATNEDKATWTELADTVAVLFNSPNMASDKFFHDYMESKISKYEALAAVDRMSGRVLGVIGFSRTNSRISWFAVQPNSRDRGIGKRLLGTALRHLDNKREIIVITFPADCAGGEAARAVYQKAGFTETEEFNDENGNKRCKMTLSPTNEKRGGSFHFKYLDYAKYSLLENCLCCNNAPAPDSLLDIAELEYSFATAERIAQGRLFGKCHVLMKNHYVNFEDIPHDEMAGFMSDVQRVGSALRKVTGAVKINYEIHANSGPHIHCHLFPRYLDDDFPSAPIDYRITEPSPYESDEEFIWFVVRMREELLK